MLLLSVIDCLIAIKLSFVLLFLVICYLILIKFTASSILSYVLCDGLSEMPKNKGSCVFSFARLLFLLIKCNLGYQLCSGYKPFLKKKREKKFA